MPKTKAEIRQDLADAFVRGMMARDEYVAHVDGPDGEHPLAVLSNGNSYEIRQIVHGGGKTRLESVFVTAPELAKLLTEIMKHRRKANATQVSVHPC